MLLWHLAATVFLFRWIFRDPAADLRWLVAGALLPDVVDLGLGTVFGSAPDAPAELWMHTPAVPLAVGVVALLVTRRGTARKRVLTVVIGMFLHLLIDRVWTDTSVFLWPFAGLDLRTGTAPLWPAAWGRALADPWRWALEAVGAVYLVGLWRRFGLSSAAVRKEVAATGRLPLPPTA